MQAIDRIANLFEAFAPADLARLGDFYAPDATFKDPFNDVRGLPAIVRVYEHMFATLEQPRFAVTHRIAQGRNAVLLWEFRFASRSIGGGRGQLIRGASHLLLDDGGRIAAHRDYWDAAEELYEKLPLVGALMRWLKRRLATPA